MKTVLSVYLGNRSAPIGRLAYDDQRPKSAQFCYDESWLNDPDAFEISPDLPQVLAWTYTNCAESSSPFPMAVLTQNLIIGAAC